MGINGEGIGFYQKTLVFVPGALKGEDIYCQITSIKRNFVEAKLLKVNKKSKFRVVPACTIYNECGGCQIMHLHYDKQLEFKTDLLHQALKKFAPAGYENYEIRPTIGMQEPKYYRAKLQFQTRKFKNQVKAGLYAQNSHYLVELKDCLVQDKETQVIANRLAELLTYHQIPITDERKTLGVRTIMEMCIRDSNKVIMIGRLTSTPELHKTNNDKSVARATIAVNRRYKDQNGEREADFVNMVLWGRLAESLASYATKGSLISVDGELRTRRFEKNGQMNYVTEVLATGFQLLESRAQRAMRENNAGQNLADLVLEEEELPF